MLTPRLSPCLRRGFRARPLVDPVRFGLQVRFRIGRLLFCFTYGLQGHVKRFFPLRVNPSGVSKSSRTLSHQSSRGRYRYQTQRGQASEASRGSTFKPAW